jgi:initiation factor 1A
MVKNTTGGSGHKKFAHKNATAPKSNKLRVSDDEAEIYAIVTKMLGNGMFHCHCIDNTLRLGHIRRNFAGRSKRDNLVEIGKWVLIGLREWDVSTSSSSASSASSASSGAKGKGKIQHCDLLEVYTDMEKLRLKESVAEKWSILESNDSSKLTTKDAKDQEDDFEFCTDRDIEKHRLTAEMNSTTAERITAHFEESEMAGGGPARAGGGPGGPGGAGGAGGGKAKAKAKDKDDEINFDDI